MMNSQEPDNTNLKVLNVAFRGYEDGTVDFFGDQIAALTDFSKEEFNVHKKKWTDIIVSEDREKTKRVFVKALKTDKTYMREYRIRKKNGKLAWIQEWSQIVCDENGRIDYILGILVDISKSKQMEEARLKAERLTGKYLVFSLAEQEYGVSVLKVREIVGVTPIRPIPQMPPFVKGATNLRGKVIPIVDLRLRLGMGELAHTDRTCVIVVQINTLDRIASIGLVVDSVSNVAHIHGADIEDTPNVFVKLGMNCILGMARIDKGIKILLDLDQTLGELTHSLANIQP